MSLDSLKINIPPYMVMTPNYLRNLQIQQIQQFQALHFL